MSDSPGPLPLADEVPEWLAPLLRATGTLESTMLTRMPPPEPDFGRASAVLVLFGYGNDGPDILLLRRADDLSSHPGQVAFPGGRLDAEDRGPVDAALREAYEEVGVLAQGVRPVAVLPELYLAYSAHRVTPVVGHWREPSPVAPVDPAETAAVARVPISLLCDPASRFRVRHSSGYLGPAFGVPGMVVWGFTGVLLAEILDLAGWSVPWDKSVVRDLDEAWRVAHAAVGDGDARTKRRGDL